MKDERWNRIVRFLYEEGREVLAAELAKKMELSPKTIKTIWNEQKENDPQAGFLVHRSRIGSYRLEILDPNKLPALWQEIPSDGLDSQGTESESRLNYMIFRLIQAGGYLRIEELAEELHVSRATLDRLMPRLKEITAEYNLTVRSRPKHGICLDGTEMNKRICCAHRVRSRILEDNEALTARVQEILLQTIRAHGLLLNDINFYNLVQHCVIALRRIASDNHLEEAPLPGWTEEMEAEQAAAREIVAQFEREFLVEIPPAEEQYLVMHLLGKRILKQTQTINPEVFACIDAIFAEILDKKGLDLRRDTELRAALALHIQPLMARLRFGLRQDNPILQDIKREMTRGYELAVCAAEVLARLYGLQMNEDEAGYLALHFTVALEKGEKAQTNRKIAIVCASGRGTARLIRHRLTERYHFQAEDLILTSALVLDELDWPQIQCILSTIPLPGNWPAPVIQIDLAMSEQSMGRVERFLHGRAEKPFLDRKPSQNRAAHTDGKTVSGSEDLETGDADKPAEAEEIPLLCFVRQDLKSREEVIDFLCSALDESGGLPPDFREQVYRRESLSSTEVGNGLALPHPYQYEENTVRLAVLSLKKPIRWKYHTVRLVILMALPLAETKESARLNDAVAALGCDREACRRLAEELDEKTIKALLLA